MTILSKLNLFHIYKKESNDIYLEPSDLFLTMNKIYPTQPPAEVSHPQSTICPQVNVKRKELSGHDAKCYTEGW